MALSPFDLSCCWDVKHKLTLGNKLFQKLSIWYLTAGSHCVVSLCKTLYPPLSTGSNEEDRKLSDMTEKSLTVRILIFFSYWKHCFTKDKCFHCQNT